MKTHAPKGPKNKETTKQEGAGNNDERELPERLNIDDAAKIKDRPPTNNAPDRERDPASPNYLEPHAKDKGLNN
ncbi:MAG: hypothetical protein LKM36_05595 [Flavobacteriales bacterium]|jgi:hypothetical protein|nr:hypothetical protein [Flavobacteriales bacterium]MBP9159852.1 hypothetical protein [Flavobacteriales bacterium]MCI1752349.1 hypothetical protein [Flavobacteriales bacterium]